MAITAAMVKELREMTGAGMMDCKKALNETNGDMDAAVEFLRKNGQAKAEKKAGRIAAEGLCKVVVKDDQVAAVVEVNSETDFVAKNEKFQDFVAQVADQALASDAADMDAFMAEQWNADPAKTVKDALVEQIAVIGENLNIRRFEKVTAANGCVVSYTHGGGRIGVIVEAETDVVNDAVKEALTNVAMQVAALYPKYVSTDEVSGALEMTNPEGIEPPFTTTASSAEHHLAYGKDFFYETTKYNPHSPYSASKASSDHFVRAFHDTYGMPTIVTNCSNNYGPYQFPEKLIPLFINNIRNRKPLPVYGKGENVRDWLYVEDHARAIDVIFHNGKIAETYNIGGFNEWKNIDIIKTVINTVDRLLGRKEGEDMNLITYVTDRLGHDARYAIDSTKLQKELGWEPSLQFEEGIEKTVKWYLDNEEWMNNVTSGEYEKYYENMYKNR